MRLPVVSAVLAVAAIILPAATGLSPALAQDFSITNPADPLPPGHRDLLRQLQAWWDMHAFYPRRASGRNEGGTVRLRLVIRPDGNIWTVVVVEGSGSDPLDAAAVAAFRGGFVRPFPAGEPEVRLDVSLHYVLAHRAGEPVAAGVASAVSRRPFTITNEPVRSPILETMLQRTCTGTVVKEGIRNHPMYGGRYSAQAIFFRKPDGTPWVRFDEGGEPLIAPVTEAGRLVQWTGRVERPRKNVEFYYQYTVWPSGENTLSGNIEAYFYTGLAQGTNTSGMVEFSCATEVVPPIPWSPLSVKVYQAPPLDPP